MGRKYKTIPRSVLLAVTKGASCSLGLLWVDMYTSPLSLSSLRTEEQSFSSTFRALLKWNHKLL